MAPESKGRWLEHFDDNSPWKGRKIGEDVSSVDYRLWSSDFLGMQAIYQAATADALERIADALERRGEHGGLTN